MNKFRRIVPLLHKKEAQGANLFRFSDSDWIRFWPLALSGARVMGEQRRSWIERAVDSEWMEVTKSPMTSITGGIETTPEISGRFSITIMEASL